MVDKRQAGAGNIPPRAPAPGGQRNPVAELRGLSRLAIEATRGVTDLVEAMHLTIGSFPGLLGEAPSGRTRGIPGLVFRSIRGVTDLVGGAIDLAAGQLAPWVAGSEGAAAGESILAALNGVLGDHLAATGNPLAVPMRLRRGGRPLVLEREALRAALPSATRKVVVLVHGSCGTDLHWTRGGHDHGAALERDFGYTAVYLHYNSGLHVSDNGRRFAHLLQSLVDSWPCPIDELTIVAHSMGGLVSRSACDLAARARLPWLALLRNLVFLGTPHHGAPLERGGNWIDTLLAVSPYSAPFARLGKIRSAGVTDLRFGTIREEDWAGRDRFLRGPDSRLPVPLPPGVACFAIAGRRGEPGSALRGDDGLVPVESALGRHSRPELRLDIPPPRQWIAAGIGHQDLLGSPAVYEVLARWLSPDGRCETRA